MLQSVVLTVLLSKVQVLFAVVVFLLGMLVVLITWPTPVVKVVLITVGVVSATLPVIVLPELSLLLPRALKVVLIRLVTRLQHERRRVQNLRSRVAQRILKVGTYLIVPVSRTVGALESCVALLFLRILLVICILPPFILTEALGLLKAQTNHNNVPDKSTKDTTAQCFRAEGGQVEGCNLRAEEMLPETMIPDASSSRT